MPVHSAWRMNCYRLAHAFIFMNLTPDLAVAEASAEFGSGVQWNPAQTEIKPT
jgi:hypothetical protein